ncbi:hypothetical protein [Sinomicrobium weinanense]|uniref:Uncharacterized protein n=1 Tax=Sinomicrobium weinanense TaxID=2842200 RepID=A0A926JT60_9FLAO|nr:hypothetical protein [Sinomicrobium weinanense]MBC9796906.1 hypothetical protein [Sinomicrobium weinanense]MBU3124214.1 hypothetical protein [Sinomicrobium weinanense]
MAKYTEENLRKAKASLSHFFGAQLKEWEQQGFIPDIYLEGKSREYISEKEARALREILLLKTVKYSTLGNKEEIGYNTLMDFRSGKKKKLYRWQYNHVRDTLNTLAERIAHVVQKPVEPTLAYLEEVCELLEDRRLVKTSIYRAVEGCPRPTITWFYSGIQGKYGESIEKRMDKYRSFFEGLRKYLAELKEKISMV